MAGPNTHAAFEDVIEGGKRGEEDSVGERVRWKKSCGEGKSVYRKARKKLNFKP